MGQAVQHKLSDPGRAMTLQFTKPDIGNILADLVHMDLETDCGGDFNIAEARCRV